MKNHGPTRRVIHGGLTMGQESIIGEVIEERGRQDAEWGSVHDDGHTPGDWVAKLKRHLGLASGEGVGTDLGRYRRQMIRVAALAVAALESMERKYVPLVGLWLAALEKAAGLTSGGQVHGEK
jgi:hypothetical protein